MAEDDPRPQQQPAGLKGRGKLHKKRNGIVYLSCVVFLAFLWVRGSRWEPVMSTLTIPEFYREGVLIIPT